MDEIWKDVIEYEKLYQVSNLGRVRSYDKVYERKLHGRTFNQCIKGRIMSLYDHGNGYIYVTLR